MRNAKVIYLGGVPASGKSSVFRVIRDAIFTGARPFACGLCRGIAVGQFRMLGVFDGSTFEGTDKLSMAVIGDALSYLRKLDALPGRTVCFMEGDRLFCKRFIEETGASVHIVDAHPDVLAVRLANRAAGGEPQSEQSLKARRTKVENLAAALGVEKWWNDSPADQTRIVRDLLAEAQEWLNGQD